MLFSFLFCAYYRYILQLIGSFIVFIFYLPILFTRLVVSRFPVSEKFNVVVLESQSFNATWHAFINVFCRSATRYVVSRCHCTMLQVEMRNMDTGDLTKFLIDGWLSKSKGDKQLIRDVPATVKGKSLVDS